MFATVIVLCIIVCILLTLVVLIQNPKGGGIASNFSAGNKIMGVKRTNDFVEKATWTLVLSLLVLALASNLFTAGDNTSESVLKKQFEEEGVPAVESPMQAPVPGAPATNGANAPASGGTPAPAPAQ